MFQGRSAWFSQSVSAELRDLWVTEGGVISTHQGADYLFSSDASHPDTQRIHQSLDYIEGKATVFHSCYLSAKASASPEMKQTVALGHFLLPPACVQEEIRRKLGSFIWEHMNDSLMEQLDEPTSVEIKSSIKEDEQSIKGKKDLDGSSKEKRGSETPVGGKLDYCVLQDYPVNNMVTGYVSSSDMKKYLGELHDFIPGTSGYSVYCIKNEIDIFSDVKNKLKRKL
ncbi:telomere repeats-binding bouquet formation protein 2 isoform X1 [Emydura macquarii macquarii]|uniref:telomere repeats-binding bouquet formation protein 2 isoform X1 n=1 Tax=Emydura macquarii macquarii TaxID=1129001 RepID=UPI00352AE007